jgi:NOL1/NOP2/fmu family ribosome biogenesis protein
MNRMNILNSKETKYIFTFIREQWGVEDFSFIDNFVFRMGEDNNIYISNREVFDLDFSKLRIDVLGLYIGQWRNNEFRFSIEGSQIVGPHAKKNILELSREASREWLKGKDLDVQTDCKGFVIVKSGDDFLGCGRIKENRLLNFVPKVRRINCED